MDAVLQVVKTTPEPDVLGRKDQTDGTPKPPEPPVLGPDGKPLPETKDEEVADEEAALAAEANAATKTKINRLFKQRRELRREVEQLRPDASVGGRLSSFAREHDLAPDDIVFGLTAMAAVRRGDYAAFYQAISPYVRKAQEVLGLVLPEDLGGRVQQGQLSEAAARELAVTRFNQQRAQEEARVNAERYSSAQIHAVQSDVQRAVTSFEERLAANDPDYGAKADAIKRTAQALLLERGGKIGTVEDALDLVSKAHREVTAQYRRFAPQPRATAPAPNGHSQQPNARPAPKNMMEAALAGLENARRTGAG
jgi:ElaB/YqjD/DUF883 family membrane-anchored ribosome-binding protein